MFFITDFFVKGLGVIFVCLNVHTYFVLVWLIIKLSSMVGFSWNVEKRPVLSSSVVFVKLDQLSESRLFQALLLKYVARY